MSAERDDDQPAITLLSSTGQSRGHVPTPRTTSGVHSRDALTNPPPETGLELDRRPRAAPAEPPSLELDDHRAPPPGEPTTGPGGKKLRPEVAAWASELETGEHKLSELRAQGAPGAPQEGGLPNWEGVQKPGTPVPVPKIPMQSRRPPPEAAPASGNARNIILGVIGAAALGLVGLVGYRVLFTEPPPPVKSNVTAADDEFVRKMRAAAEGAPECWAGDDGWDFIYEGASGAPVKVTRIQDVPALYRRQAKCVPE